MGKRILYNNLCTSMTSAESKPIICNGGMLFLKPRSISVITVQAPTQLDTHHIYTFYISEDLSLGVIPLAVEHKIKHIYPKSLGTAILSIAYNKVCISYGNCVTGTLQPVEVESSKVVNIS